MTDELAAKVGVFLAGKLIYPVLAWAGARTIGWGAGALNGLGDGQRVALLLGGMGAATYVLYRPEQSLDYLLGGVATVANTTGQALGVVANQVRTLEKVDLEKYFNDQVEFLGPYFEPEDEPEDNKIRALPEPPPLLPKDYNVENFPWCIKSGTQLRYINDTDVDPIIGAYNVLGINVVAMILKDRQLPQMKLVKDIYIQKIKLLHPDKNMDSDLGEEGSTELASLVNLAYTKIKKMMRSADEQAEIITPVLQYFHKGYFSPTPYIILFFAGVAFAVWLAS